MRAQAVEWFVGDWGGVGPLDLTQWLLVVPTRQAGRRLREALRNLPGAMGRPCFPRA